MIITTEIRKAVEQCLKLHYTIPEIKGYVRFSYRQWLTTDDIVAIKNDIKEEEENGL